MSKIKNIVFDFGGVLIDWNPHYLYRDYFKNEKEMDYFLENICTQTWNTEQDRGRSFDEAVRILQEQYPEYHEAISLYRDGWQHMIKGEIKKGVDLLRRLKSEGYKIYGLTNWSAEKIGIAYEMFDFFSLFDGIVVSGEEKVIKPDRRIFEILLARYDLKADESIFIDDNLFNIKAAENLGFNAILCDDFARVNREVDRLLRS